MAHQDLNLAIHEARLRAPAGIGWAPDGWTIYDLYEGCPEGLQPEVCVLKGAPPLPLNDVAAEAVHSGIEATLAIAA